MSLPIIQQQLASVGKAAQVVGPRLDSPTQAPGPVDPWRTSMTWDRYVGTVNPPSLADPTGNQLGTSWGSLNPKQPTIPGINGPAASNPYYNPQGSAPLGGSGAVGSLGGEFAVLDQYDAYFQEASAATGMPVNVLKAIAAVERGWEGTSVAGAQGIMQVMPFWGADFGLNLQDPRQNILAGAKVLKSGYDQYGSMDMAIRSYLGFGQDAYGTTDQAYLQRVNQFLAQLNANGGSFSGGTVAPINGMWGGNAVGNSFVQAALQYQGVDYVWGAIPGANQDPWQTGWDCSGFTYFMSQKYGDGSLPMGSHYQYQYAQTTGRLFTDLNQLQPGDLVFIDTGWYGGAGGDLNAAGHVGIYIGNGQMIHASNPSTGTIVSPLSGYGGILGAMHQSGSGGVGGYTSGTSSYGTYGSGGQQLTQTQMIQNFLRGLR